MDALLGNQPQQRDYYQHQSGKNNYPEYAYHQTRPKHIGHSIITFRIGYKGYGVQRKQESAGCGKYDRQDQQQWRLADSDCQRHNGWNHHRVYYRSNRNDEMNEDGNGTNGNDETLTLLSELNNGTASITDIETLTLNGSDADASNTTVNIITTDDELKIHRQYYMNLFSYCIHTGNFDQGITAFKEHQKFLKKNKSQSFLKHTFFFQYFYLHFGAGLYNEALQYMNDWLNLKTNTEKQDLQALARILNLVIHKELGNEILIQSLTRSATRFLNKISKPSKYEEAVLKYFRRSLKDIDKSDEQKSLELLLRDIKTIKSNRIDNHIMNLFDMESWVISKLNDVPFKDVKQQYFK